MSVQDYIFDITDTLKGTDVEKDFDKFTTIFGEMEVELERLSIENATLRRAIKIMGDP